MNKNDFIKVNDCQYVLSADCVMREIEAVRSHIMRNVEIMFKLYAAISTILWIALLAIVLILR